jgi:RNA polymerase sigma-70 factor, ECF subfamily
VDFLMTRPDLPAETPSRPSAEALDAEIVRCAPEIAAFLAHHAGDRAVGADLAQDVLAAAFRGVGAMRAPETVRPWLYRIAVNRFHDHLRRARRAPAIRPFAERPDPRAEASPEKAALRREMEDVLREAVAALPARQRGVFLLHGVEGFDHRAIAEACGLSAGAVKTALYHAREALRARLSRYLGEPGRDQGEDR